MKSFAKLTTREKVKKLLKSGDEFFCQAICSMKKVFIRIREPNLQILFCFFSHPKANKTLTGS
jgi:hypothetical protein